MSRCTDRQTDRQTERDRQTDRQTDRQADRQTDRQASSAQTLSIAKQGAPSEQWPTQNDDIRLVASIPQPSGSAAWGFCHASAKCTGRFAIDSTISLRV